MAFDAAFLQDPGNLPRIGDFAFIGRLQYAAYETSRGLRFRFGDRLSFEKLVKSVGQVGLFRSLTYVADAVLIVDPSVITNHPLLIEHVDFGSPLSAELVCDGVLDVLEDGKCDLILACEAGQVADAVLLIRIDSDEAYAFRLVCLGQFNQAGAVELWHPAVRADKRNYPP